MLSSAIQRYLVVFSFYAVPVVRLVTNYSLFFSESPAVKINIWTRRVNSLRKMAVYLATIKAIQYSRSLCRPKAVVMHWH